MYIYKAFVLAVLDADTIIATIDMGFQVYKRQRLKLANVEVSLDDYQNKKTRDWLKSLILNKDVLLKVKKSGRGDNGVYYAEVFIDEENEIKSINEWLVRENLANYKNK